MIHDSQPRLKDLTGFQAVAELERLGVFNKPIIGCFKKTYKDDIDLSRFLSYLSMGRDRLGALFGLTWQQAMTDVWKGTVPIECNAANNSIWVHFYDGGSIYLKDVTRLTRVFVSEDQVKLFILGERGNLHLLYSVFFDTPSSNLNMGVLGHLSDLNQT